MISIIICSINPQLVKQVTENIASTVGVEHEVIVFDNRGKKWGLSKVYNYCAEKSLYPYLCFVHEDMLLYTQKWGNILTNFIQNRKDCGIIGFAGSRFVPRNYVDWILDKKVSRVSCTLSANKKSDMLMKFSNIKNSFDEVIVLDGMFLFVSKFIWDQYKFDEENFKKFHLYDSDFSFTVAQKYKNYVCGIVENTHLCQSKLDETYTADLLSFHNKWKTLLPKNCDTMNFIYEFWTELVQIKRTIILYKTNGYKYNEIWKIIKNRNPIKFMLFLPLTIFSRPISLFTNIKIRPLKAISYNKKNL